MKSACVLAVCGSLLMAPAISAAKEKAGKSAAPAVTKPSKPAVPEPKPAPKAPKIDVEKGSLAYLDARNGFLDMTFGDSFEKHAAKLVLVEKGDTLYYRLKSPVKSLGDAKLHDLAVGFYKGRMSDVMIRTKGYVNSRAILKVLTANYGDPYQPNEYLEEYYWFGNVVRVSFDQNSISDDATVWISSIAEYERYEADKAKTAESIDL